MKKRFTALICVVFEENVLCQVTFMCSVCVRNSRRNSRRSSARGRGVWLRLKTWDSTVVSSDVR